MWGLVVLGLLFAVAIICMWYEYRHEDVSLTFSGIKATIYIEDPFRLVKYSVHPVGEAMIVEIWVCRSRLFGQSILLFFEVDPGGKVTSTNIKELFEFASGVYTLLYEAAEGEFYLVENSVPFVKN